jgi:hypothetical protein
MPYRVALQFAVGPDVEKPTRRIVGPCAKGIAVREELDGIDVGVVRSKCLTALLLANVPQFCKGIARSRDELVVIKWIYAQAHDITKMVCELGDLLASLNIPQHTGHVARRGEDAPVIDEPAAAEVAGVAT